MSNTLRIPKQWNSSRHEFAGLTPFVPYHTDNPEVEMRRRTYHDTVLESQFRGIQATQRLAAMRQELGSTANRRYIDDLIAEVGLGTHHHAQLEQTLSMFCPLPLPQLVNNANGERQYATTEELQARQLGAIAHGLAFSKLVLGAHRQGNNPERVARCSQFSGRYLGTSALLSLSLAMPAQAQGMHPYDAGHFMRDSTREFVLRTKQRAHDLGAIPSAAQLVEPDAPLAVDIRRHAPTEVKKIFTAVIKTLPEERLSA